MTISRDSKSYPYLAIAQHYNVSYAEVLNFSKILHNLNVIQGHMGPAPWSDWRYAVWQLEQNKFKNNAD